MKRRDFLIGIVAAATAVVVAKPALAMPAIHPTKPKIDFERWKEHIFKDVFPGRLSNQRNGFGPVEYDEGDEYFELFKKLNTKLIDENHDLFDYEPTFAPTAFRDHPIHGQYHVVAQSRTLKSSYNYDSAQELKNLPPYFDGEDMLHKFIVNDIATELRRFKNKNPDIHMAFYVPITPCRFVNPTTFQPSMGFKTRYADVNFNNLYKPT